MRRFRVQKCGGYARCACHLKEEKECMPGVSLPKVCSVGRKLCVCGVRHVAPCSPFAFFSQAARDNVPLTLPPKIETCSFSIFDEGGCPGRGEKERHTGENYRHHAMSQSGNAKPL